jgi:hypothetical protein
MNQTARPFYFPWEPPFRFVRNGGLIVDARGKMFAEMRGWGFLTGRSALAARLSHEEGAVIQEKMGEHLVELINHTAGISPPLPLSFEDWVERAREAGQVKGITYPIVRRAFEAGHHEARKESETFMLKLLDVATGHAPDTPPSLARVEQMLRDRLFPDPAHNHVVRLTEAEIAESDRIVRGMRPRLSFRTLPAVPEDHPVQPLITKEEREKAVDLAQCGECLRYWDDGLCTSMTPAPSARCPFEAYHAEES